MRLSNFMINSDYTAEKQAYSFTVSYHSSSVKVNPRDTIVRYTDVDVPEGKYFQTVNLVLSLAGSQSYPCGYLAYSLPNDDIFIRLWVSQMSNKKYRLYVYIFNDDWDNKRTAPAFDITAKVHLSVSPFD